MKGRPISEPNRALIHAAMTGQQDLILQLLSDGTNVEADDGIGFTPLFHAARQGQVEIVLLLLDHGANINGNSSFSPHLSPLVAAASQAQTKICEILLQRQAKHAETALCIAAENNHLDVINLILLIKPNIVTHSSSYRSSPLAIAMNYAHDEAFHSLLKNAGEINQLYTHFSGRTETLLHTAVLENNIAVVLDLLNAGADSNVTASDGATALSIAVRNKNLNLIKRMTSTRVDD